jgi:hypothetical protein
MSDFFRSQIAAWTAAAAVSTDPIVWRVFQDLIKEARLMADEMEATLARSDDPSGLVGAGDEARVHPERRVVQRAA